MKGKIQFCKRRGCEATRLRKQFVCSPCWGEIPAADRHRYMRARRNGLTQIASSIRSEIMRALGRKLATANPPAANPDTFTNIARLTGDRDAMEPAE
ncbi:hypothetical protein HZY97_20330 [Sphingomonas sp. R-74633]|uniref:hypothetical protein n=1 Tax=Sphingomonas sp. R-74633 TaxID=2751188 RepID=UPI0015D1A784|nr:hypothetical protein [Sphingomonas sp. R-74633]NYT43134.1 hypothetical protein [Sphingomonas sp. R-74633]